MHWYGIVATFLTAMLKLGFYPVLQNVFPVPLFCAILLKYTCSIAEVSLRLFMEEKQNKKTQNISRKLSWHNAATRLLAKNKKHAIRMGWCCPLRCKLMP